MPDAGELLRQTRRQAGLTQQQLAARLGTTQSAIARMERRDANPTVGWLDRALRAAGSRLELGVPAPDVDESQIRERLRLTPAQRLASFQASHSNLAALLRSARRVGTP